MVIGVGLVAVSVFLWEEGVIWYGAPIGLVILAAGLVGFRRGSAAADVKPTMAVEQFKQLVEHRDLGFYVCTKCRTLMDRDWGNGCANCGSMAEFLEVSSEDDRKIALAAIV